MIINSCLIPLIPSKKTDTEIHYEIPLDGDVVDCIRIEGLYNKIDVLVAGELMWCSEQRQDFQVATETVPLTLNLLAIGIHSRIIRVYINEKTNQYPMVTAKFTLLDDGTRLLLASPEYRALNKWSVKCCNT